MNSEGTIQTLARSYRESVHSNNISKVMHSIQSEGNPFEGQSDLIDEYASSWPTQFRVLAKRTLLHNFRNPYLIRTQYILTVLLAILIGTIYWHVTDDIPGTQNRAGSLFFMIALLSFGSMSSIDTFFQERPLFVRERANGMYRTSAYFLAKATCDLVPMRVVPPIILGTISYFMIGLRSGIDHFLYMLLILVLVCLVAGTMCLVISAFTPSLSLGNLVAILLLLFFMLFGGFLVNKSSVPPIIQWLKWLSFLNFGFEVLMVNELDGLTVLFQPKGYNIKPVLVEGDVVLANLDMDPSRFYLDIVVLGIMSAVYLVLSYLMLRFVVKEKR
jgi:ABC-type multidrug transport system permease subunit